ncbi:MAG: hypothetical protein ACLFQB_11680 [Chitinispirillaceae bacterium]
MAALNLGSEGLSTSGINGKVGVGTTSPSEVFEVSGGNSRLGGGDYNNGHIVLGNYHIWVDGNGDLRIKNGIPASTTDGTVVGSQS